MEGTPTPAETQAPPQAPAFPSSGAGVPSSTPKKKGKPGRKPLNAAEQEYAIERARLRRKFRQLAKTQELDKLRAAVEAAEGAKPGVPLSAEKSPHPAPVEVPGVAAPLPDNVLPFQRPGFPSEGQIAESMPLAEMAMMFVQLVAKPTAWGPGLQDKVEVPVRRSDGSMGRAEVTVAHAITEKLAVVLAKYGAAIADSPEAQLALVTLPWLTKPLFDKYMPLMLARMQPAPPDASQQVAA